MLRATRPTGMGGSSAKRALIHDDASSEQTQHFPGPEHALQNVGCSVVEARVAWRRPAGEKNSGEDALDEFAVDVGEAEVTALVAEGQAFVVEAQAVED